MTLRLGGWVSCDIKRGCKRCIDIGYTLIGCMVYSSENSKVDEREKFADKIAAHSHTESVLRHNETKE